MPETSNRARRRPTGRTPAPAPVEMPTLDVSAYTCVTKPDELQDWVERARRGGVVAVDTETDGLDAMHVGWSAFRWPWHRARRAMCHWHGAGDGLDLGAETPEQLDEQRHSPCWHPC